MTTLNTLLTIDFNGLSKPELVNYESELRELLRSTPEVGIGDRILMARIEEIKVLLGEPIVWRE